MKNELTPNDPCIIKKNNSGYSLIELMIVVAIIAVIGLIAIPSLTPSNNRLKQAARELYSNLQNTRTEAIKRNTEWAIKFFSGTDSYTICNDDGGDADWTDGDETCPTTVTLADYGSVVRFGFGSATVDVPGAAPIPANVITYTNDILIFNSTGLSNLGYVYIQNNKNSTFAVGTPSLAGVVVTRKWFGGSWQ